MKLRDFISYFTSGIIDIDSETLEYDIDVEIDGYFYDVIDVDVDNSEGLISITADDHCNDY